MANMGRKPNAGNNTGMPARLKSGIENLSGTSMSDVKVHYNSPRPAQLQAHAYAQGSNIHVAQGQAQHLAHESASQARHLNHETTHVVQQRQGRVQPTMQMGGGQNQGRSLERQADKMGTRAMHGAVKK